MCETYKIAATASDVNNFQDILEFGIDSNVKWRV